MPARRHLLFILLLAWTASLSGCALQAPAQSCPNGMKAMKSELLYFGTASPRGPVTPAQWSDFLDRNVTPHFPAGLSVWQADGQWRGSDGSVEREESYVLNVVHADSPADERAFTAIIDAYKTQFQQEAVLRVQGEICANLP